MVKKFKLFKKQKLDLKLSVSLTMLIFFLLGAALFFLIRHTTGGI